MSGDEMSVSRLFLSTLPKYFRINISFGDSLYSAGMASVFGSFAKSLKAILLHNVNICSLPGEHCVKLTFQYSQHNWKICGGLKKNIRRKRQCEVNIFHIKQQL